MGRIRTRLSSDDGMTLIEVVIAASILFIALTGVLSLLTQTIHMSLQAQEVNYTNNAVNSYVEWVRSLPYEQVALSTESTAGALASITTTEGAYSIQIVPTVAVSGLDSEGNLKELNLAITVSRPDGYLRTLSTVILIRDKDQYMVGTARSAATDPKVSFVIPTGAEGSVVRGNSVPIAVTGQATSGRMLEVGSYWVDNVRKMRSLGTTATAEWEITASTWNPVTYYWDTTLVEGGVRIVPDGLRTVLVYVRDSEGIEVYASRQLIVDNLAPSTPTTPTHTPAGSVGGKLAWPVVYDGTTLTAGYEVEMRVQGTTSTSGNPFDTGSAWSAVTGYTGPQASFVVPAEPFNRYFARVRAYSAHPTSPLRSDWRSVAAPFISRPRLTGTYTVTIKNGAIDKIRPALAATPPAFPLAASTPITYEWHRIETGLTAQGAPWQNDTIVHTSTTPYWTPTTAANITSRPTGIGYYVKVTCTPGGFMGGLQGSWSSNTATCPSLLINGVLQEGNW